MSRLHRCGRVVMVIIAIFGVGLAIYLSLKSSPRMTAVEWLPKWITRWADYHGQVRNFPAFALLSVPVLFIFQRPRQRAIAFGILALLIVLLELLQINLPQRSPDLRDVIWGWCGLGFPWALSAVVTWLRHRRQPNRSRASSDSKSA